ncbi:MAG: threonine synthase [Bacteroidota bacterium]
MKKEEFKYVCEECGREFQIEKNRMLCPNCREDDLAGKPLHGVLKVRLPSSFRGTKREADHFDIFEYLPVEKEYFPPFPVGNTPLVEALNIRRGLGYKNIFLKFDGTNPTGSFKDRASFLVSAFAKKHAIEKIVVASTGNAASSMAGVAASAGQEAIIFMPATAPRAKLVQCLQYGATLIPIQGNYDAAFDLSLKFSERTGFLNRNTAYNPMTIEGKKTVSFEIVAQMQGKQIEYVFLPVGDGVVLSGVIKGFLDLQFLGLIQAIPKVIGVQAEGSSFIHTAFHHHKFDLNYKADTIADSISVNAARNAYTAVSDLKKVGGDVILVSDKQILDAQQYLSKMSGIFCEPSSAASFAGFVTMKDRISRDAAVVVLLTGHGLKDIDSAMKGVTFPRTFEPDIEMILQSLGFDH